MRVRIQQCNPDGGSSQHFAEGGKGKRRHGTMTRVGERRDGVGHARLCTLYMTDCDADDENGDNLRILLCTDESYVAPPCYTYTCSAVCRCNERGGQVGISRGVVPGLYKLAKMIDNIPACHVFCRMGNNIGLKPARKGKVPVSE